MREKDYRKTYPELLFYPEEVNMLIDRLRPYQIDFEVTWILYLVSFEEYIEMGLENLFNRYKTSDNNRNKLRKIINELLCQANFFVIPTAIAPLLKNRLYRAIQTDDSFMYLQMMLEDDLGLKKHDVFDIMSDKLLRMKIEESIKNEINPVTNSSNNLLSALQPYLNVLQENGFIENAAEKPLKWLKSKSLLAYFVDVANDKLHLQDSGGRKQIKPFETLFNVSGLAGCINEYKNKTGQKPQGYKEMDEVFR